MAHEIDPEPLVLFGPDLAETLEMSVEGPELTRGALEMRFQASAEAAISGMRSWFLDHGSILPPEDAIEVSGTYPPVARMTRRGAWYGHSEFAPEFDLDVFMSGLTDEERRKVTEGQIAVILNAMDFPRNLRGVVWGPTELIQTVAADQRQRRHMQLDAAAHPPKLTYGWGTYPSVPLSSQTFTTSHTITITDA